MARRPTGARHQPGRLELKGLTVQYGAIAAVSDVDAIFETGSINGLIGPNGAGKTTLLNAISGFTGISAGAVELDGVDLTRLPARERVGHGIVRGFQTVRLLERETVFDNVLLGCERFAQPNFFAQLFNLPPQSRALGRDWVAAGEILEILGLADDVRRPVSELPFASRRLTEIARILVVRPTVLLLDEPAAGLDAGERQKLTAILKDYHASNPFTMIVIEHDVDLVKQLCPHSLALDSGRVIAVGPPAEVLASNAVKTAYFGQGHHA